jgi:hypothetical protein
MLKCELTDLSDRSESLIKLCEYTDVTVIDIPEIEEIFSYLQLPLYQVREGDYLSIYIVDNRMKSVKGYLAIWHNKGIACINTDAINLWGEWEENNMLVLSGILEAGEYIDGGTIMGRRAYNTDGAGGIYSQGRFFKFIDYAPVYEAAPEPLAPTGLNISF